MPSPEMFDEAGLVTSEHWKRLLDAVKPGAAFRLPTFRSAEAQAETFTFPRIHAVETCHAEPNYQEPTIRERLGLDLPPEWRRHDRHETDAMIYFVDQHGLHRVHPFDAYLDPDEPADPFRTIEDTPFFVDWSEPLPFRLFRSVGVLFDQVTFRVMADQREAAEWSRIFGLDADDWYLSSTYAAVLEDCRTTIQRNLDTLAWAMLVGSLRAPHIDGNPYARPALQTREEIVWWPIKGFQEPDLARAFPWHGMS